MLQILNNILSTNPALRDVMWTLMIAGCLYSNVETQKKVDVLSSSSEVYAYEVVSYSLADVSDLSEVITMIHMWKDKGWGAQFAAAKVLCDSESRKLKRLLGDQGTVNFCRVAQ